MPAHGISCEASSYSAPPPARAGRSLDKLLSKVPFASLAWSARWSIATDMARALDYLHQNNLLHRDVKSPNFLMFDGPPGGHPYTAKLGDFGLLEVKRACAPKRGTPGVGQGYFCSPNWRAPELWEEGAIETVLMMTL